MHIPAAFAVTDDTRLHQFIREHSFAVLVSADDTHDRPPIATHLPLLLQPAPSADGASHSMTLWGHMAKGNAQWQQANGRKVLAIFSGPHAAISAGWYGERNVVPTWNYVAVHVSGVLLVEEDPERLRQLVTDTVNVYEAGSDNPWSVDAADADYLKHMMHGIVGFRIDIERIEGCWKLNQHHSPARLRGAIAGLRQRGSGDDLEIARLMSENLP